MGINYKMLFEISLFLTVFRLLFNRIGSKKGLHSVCTKTSKKQHFWLEFGVTKQSCSSCALRRCPGTPPVATCEKTPHLLSLLLLPCSVTNPPRPADNTNFHHFHRLLCQCTHFTPTSALRPFSPATTTMPKNKGKGGKNRRRGKNDNDDDKRELIFKEDGQGKS